MPSSAQRAEEPGARAEGQTRERVHRSGVAEVAREADEAVGDERHADRREHVGERRRASDQARRLHAGQRTSRASAPSRRPKARSCRESRSAAGVTPRPRVDLDAPHPGRPYFARRTPTRASGHSSRAAAAASGVRLPSASSARGPVSRCSTLSGEPVVGALDLRGDVATRTPSRAPSPRPSASSAASTSSSPNAAVAARRPGRPRRPARPRRLAADARRQPDRCLPDRQAWRAGAARLRGRCDRLHRLARRPLRDRHRTRRLLREQGRRLRPDPRACRGLRAGRDPRQRRPSRSHGHAR